jgi:cupin fold WbuC family metalloprotein
MLNALQPGSYIQPHRHLAPPKAESTVVLRGAICYVSFTETGEADKHVIVSAGSDTVGIDTEPGVYHTFFALEEDTVLYEVKPGPYDEKTDKDFAIWAPAEGSAQAKEYLQDLHHLVSTT